jgi:pimeloyl-ACP methyl ester carboxylesterase
MRKVISKDGTAIAFDRVGHGSPIILVDGAFCSRSIGSMPQLALLLAPHFTVINYDRRGRGDSEDTKPYAIAREIEDLEALIKEAGGSASVFGMSSGAALALKAAAAGLTIKSLALFEPPYVAEFKDSLQPPSDHVEQVTQLISLDRRSDAVKFYMTKVMGMPALFVGIMQLLPMWSKLKSVANTIPYDATIMGDFHLPTREVASITAPLLAIGGKKSPKNLLSAVQAVKNALPHAEQRILEGQTHNVSMKVLAPVLEEFFKAHSGRSSNLDLRYPHFQKTDR